MRTAYRLLAFAIAALVGVQAAAIGYAVFAQQNWIDNGGTLDKAALESSVPGTEALVFHALDGGVILFLALALLIISFFAKIPQGVRWAVIVLLWTIVRETEATAGSSGPRCDFPVFCLSNTFA
jgi:hypothetical protein